MAPQDSAVIRATQVLIPEIEIFKQDDWIELRIGGKEAFRGHSMIETMVLEALGIPYTQHYTDVYHACYRDDFEEAEEGCATETTVVTYDGCGPVRRTYPGF